MNKVSYNSKLVGVTFEGRQDVISGLTGREPLRFRREPDNEYDKNAVAVDALILREDPNTYPFPFTIEEWSPIGYIAKDKNSEIAKALDEGKEASIRISEITGGGERSFGVNVYIEYEKERQLTRSATSFLVTDIFGNEIFYDDVTHTYTNALGEIYLSGSTYAEQFDTPFDAKQISGYVANKYKLSEADQQRLQDMWSLKSEASKSFGTSVHAALELYGKYRDLCKLMDKETHLHDNPILKKAVKLFYEEHPDTDSVDHECLVIDHKMKRAGRIDRIEYDKDGVWVTDFKTGLDLTKRLKGYWRQMSFYAAILKANGVHVKGLKVYHYTGEEWVTIAHEVIDIDNEANQK